ncbi:zinc finger protein 2 homolog [Argonauta hians]
MEKLFSCEICEKEFSEILKQHTLGHGRDNGSKPEEIAPSLSNHIDTMVENDKINCVNECLEPDLPEHDKSDLVDQDNPIAIVASGEGDEANQLDNFAPQQQPENYKNNNVFDIVESNNNCIANTTYEHSLQLEADVRTGDELDTNVKLELSNPSDIEQDDECCGVIYNCETDNELPNEGNVCQQTLNLATHLIQLSSSSVEQTNNDYSVSKPYTCSLCHKSFSRNYHLKMHSLTHSGIKPFSCFTCSKSFSRSSDLKRHLTTHTGVKPFGCTLCQKYFSRSSDLRRHTATHTGERPHSCQVCQKAFTRSSDLHRHSQTHTGIKPHACQVCGKAFSTATHLKRHSTTHTTEQKAFNVTILGNLTPKYIT